MAMQFSPITDQLPNLLITYLTRLSSGMQKKPVLNFKGGRLEILIPRRKVADTGSIPDASLNSLIVRGSIDTPHTHA